MDSICVVELIESEAGKPSKRMTFVEARITTPPTRIRNWDHGTCNMMGGKRESGFELYPAAIGSSQMGFGMRDAKNITRRIERSFYSRERV